MKQIIVYYKRQNNTKRNVLVGVSSSLIKNSGNLSDFSLSSVNEVILELTKVVNGTLEDFYWGQLPIMIESTQQNSECYDEINNEYLGNVKTQDLLNLMIQIRDFKQEYQQEINLKNIIGQAFNQIKSNPQSYKKRSHLIYYEMLVNNITVTLQLEPEDFNLSSNDYVNQINLNF